MFQRKKYILVADVALLMRNNRQPPRCIPAPEISGMERQGELSALRSPQKGSNGDSHLIPPSLDMNCSSYWFDSTDFRFILLTCFYVRALGI